MADSDRLRSLGDVLLGGQSSEEKHRALDLLTDAGPDALLVLPDLVACQYNPDIEVSIHAAETIRGIGAVAMPALARLVESPDEDAAMWISGDTAEFRQYAADALADFGEPAIDLLAKLMRSSDEDAVEAAIMACDRAGTSAVRLLPMLASFWEGSEHESAAAETMLSMVVKNHGSERDAVRQFLLDQLKCTGSRPKLAILHAIHFLEADPVTAHTILEQLAADADKEVSVRARLLLDRMGIRQER